MLIYGYKHSLYALESFKDLSFIFDRFSNKYLRDLSKMLFFEPKHLYCEVDIGLLGINLV